MKNNLLKFEADRLVWLEKKAYSKGAAQTPDVKVGFFALYLPTEESNGLFIDAELLSLVRKTDEHQDRDLVSRLIGRILDKSLDLASPRGLLTMNVQPLSEAKVYNMAIGYSAVHNVAPSETAKESGLTLAGYLNHVN